MLSAHYLMCDACPSPTDTQAQTQPHTLRADVCTSLRPQGKAPVRLPEASQISLESGNIQSSLSQASWAIVGQGDSRFSS